MNTPSLRTLNSLGLAVALAAVFSLSSFAAPDANRSAEPVEPQQPGDQFGILNGTGRVLINGNKVVVGTTVLTGSSIETGSDGNAIIDLGPLGRVDIRPETTVILNFGAGKVNIVARCDRTWIEVTRGQVIVLSQDPKEPRKEEKRVNAGEADTFEGPTYAYTNGATDFIVDCVGKEPVVLWFGPGLGGVLAMAGVVTTIAIGVRDGDERPPLSDASPIRP